MRRLFLFAAGLTATLLLAQPDSIQVPNSEHGWYLSPHGTIRILVIFAEVDYDQNSRLDPQPESLAREWPKGELPVWRDRLFDAFPSEDPQGEIPRYYLDMSLGRFTVLGDYLDRVVTIRESVRGSLRDWSGASWEAANAFGELRTAHGLSVGDFNKWTDGGRPGMPKLNTPDAPHSYDHVMVILRNSHTLTHGPGDRKSVE